MHGECWAHDGELGSLFLLGAGIHRCANSAVSESILVTELGSSSRENGITLTAYSFNLIFIFKNYLYFIIFNYILLNI